MSSLLLRRVLLTFSFHCMLVHALPIHHSNLSPAGVDATSLGDNFADLTAHHKFNFNSTLSTGDDDVESLVRRADGQKSMSKWVKGYKSKAPTPEDINSKQATKSPNKSHLPPASSVNNTSKAPFTHLERESQSQLRRDEEIMMRMKADGYQQHPPKYAQPKGSSTSKDGKKKVKSDPISPYDQARIERERNRYEMRHPETLYGSEDGKFRKHYHHYPSGALHHPHHSQYSGGRDRHHMFFEDSGSSSDRSQRDFFAAGFYPLPNFGDNSMQPLEGITAGSQVTPPSLISNAAGSMISDVLQQPAATQAASSDSCWGDSCDVCGDGSCLVECFAGCTEDLAKDCCKPS